MSRIAIVLPRGMYFSAQRATSIDLCAYDYVCHSSYRDSIRVFGQAIDSPFTDVAFEGVDGGKAGFVDAIRAYDPDLIIVHQHVPSAAAIRTAFSSIPVILYRHNLYKPKSWFKTWRDGRLLAKFDAIVWVSHFANDGFVGHHPKLATKSHANWNGIDPDAFSPKEPKQKTLLFVGRASPEKGVLEVAKAMKEVLQDHPDWRGALVLSSFDKQDLYVAEVEEVVGASNGAITIRYDIPFSDVIEAINDAAIMLVPSKYKEPFGRTAIEAFAGGAALISSTRGGLNEVVGDAAIRLNEIGVSEIADAMRHLIEHPEVRQELVGKGTRRLEEHFTIEKNAQTLDGLIGQLLKTI